jgi:hypothetical protein
MESDLIRCPWSQRNLPTGSFVDVKVDCISDVYKDVNRSDRRRLETIAAEELADADHAESS